MFRLHTRMARVLLIAGSTLLLLNICGLFLTLRNPDLLERVTKARHVSRLNQHQLALLLPRSEGESDYGYMNRINRLVHQSTIHFWAEELAGHEIHSPFVLRVPPWDNYILFFTSFFVHDFNGYEFASYKKGLERGFGLCSQRSLILVGILNQAGIRAHLVNLGGHVISIAELSDGSNYLLDPDFEISTNATLDQLKSDPGLVRSLYGPRLEEEKSHVMDGTSVDLMVKIFSAGDFRVFPEGVKGYLGYKHVLFEQASYILIWLFPVILLSVAFLLNRGELRRRRTTISPLCELPLAQVANG